MKNMKYLLAGAAALALVAAGAISWAQQQISAGISGSEVVVIQQGGPGGQSIFTTTGRLASGPAYAFFSSFPSSFTIGQVAGTVNTAGIVTGGVLQINAANTAQTFTLPPTSSLIDGEVINFCNNTAAAWATNAVTVAPNSNQTVNGAGAGTLTTLGAFTCASFQWISGSSTWVRGTL